MTLLKLKYRKSAVPGFPHRQPEFIEFIGHVLTSKHHKWLDKNQFLFTTGDYDAPVRILDKRDVVNAWVDRRGGKDNVEIVENKFVVTRGPFSRYSCTCTAYKYRGKCSHIDLVKSNYK